MKQNDNWAEDEAVPREPDLNPLDKEYYLNFLTYLSLREIEKRLEIKEKRQKKGSIVSDFVQDTRQALSELLDEIREIAAAIQAQEQAFSAYLTTGFTHRLDGKRTGDILAGRIVKYTKSWNDSVSNGDPPFDLPKPQIMK